jgi:hypothetical protein
MNRAVKTMMSIGKKAIKTAHTIAALDLLLDCDVNSSHEPTPKTTIPNETNGVST